MAEPFPAEGLPLSEARGRVLAGVPSLEGSERVPLPEALGRVAAEAVRAAEAVPGFRASVMDGHAIAEADPPAVGTRWRLVGRSEPGRPYAGRLEPGQAIRILTGAPLPEGAARVLPQELTRGLSAGDPARPPSEPSAGADGLVLQAPAGPNPWIRAADEETAAGAELIAAGTRLGPADLARLAACGVGSLAVRRRPRVGLLISGDELVPPGDPRGEGQIWESNGTLLEAMLRRLGQEVGERRVVADDPGALGEALASLARHCDVLVSTGGVSVGDRDWIRSLMEERGTVGFWKLFLKPGRPFAFGEVEGRPFFGLPGNPVAAAITALQLLVPALERMEGTEPRLLPLLMVRLASALRRTAGRPELARARLEVAADGTLLARVEGSQASSRIGSLQGADLLLEIPAELGELEAGTPLRAQWLGVPLF